MGAGESDGETTGRAQPDVDVLIVGAGLSGVGMACHLTRERPGTSYAIVEARRAIGGTWDLFRYPGVRSDSDMYTLGYDFKPWASDVSIADGASIKAYVEEAAEEYDVLRHITFGRRVVGAAWDSVTDTWSVDLADTDERGEAVDGSRSTITCRWLQFCAGYYSYRQGHRPDFPGEEDFTGRIEHPQRWPDDLQTAEQLDGKRIVVIGSGATAVTLVPALAELGAHVTMLQRSPTWVFPGPARNPVSVALRKVLPERTAYRAIRRINAWQSEFVYRRSRTKPEKLRRMIDRQVDKALAGSLPRDPHFAPDYDPWDQRLCLSPDGDLFAAVREGKATVVTDHIDRFDATGIRLESGARLDADVIVTATGLELLTLGGVTPAVDGEPVDLAERFTYKGVMLSGVPNLATTFGYVNASWTLRADLIAHWVCRVLAAMEARGATAVTPVAPDDLTPEPYIVDFPAGYLQRKLHTFPKQGGRAPWIAAQSYSYDKEHLLGVGVPVEDDALVFGTPVREAAPA